MLRLLLVLTTTTRFSQCLICSLSSRGFASYITREQGQQKQKVIVVRHGETDWNKALRVQGSTDIPLNEKGIAQAKASARALSQWFKTQDYNITPSIRIYSSPLVRAKDTAIVIAGALLNCSKGVSVSDALREWNLGKLEGLTKEQAMDENPSDWRIFSHWADPNVPPKDARIQLSEGGESMEQVRWRVVQAIDNLALQEKKDDDVNNTSPIIICVTHGGVLGQLLRHVVVQQQTQSLSPKNNSDDDTIEYQRPGNACISRFSLDLNSSTVENAVPPHWTIECWADTSHLTGNLAPSGADYDK